MQNKFHSEILAAIKVASGAPTQHTYSDSYLGNDHPRYPISAPVLRSIAKEWMREHKSLTANEIADVYTSLIEGKSSTEKMMAGIMMDYSTQEQRTFNPKLFDRWLEHLVGWAEVDAVCTGKYTLTQIPINVTPWKALLTKFSKSKNIQKRRASIVLLCSPLSHSDDPNLAAIAINNIERLKSEKEILITKAISWILRSMIKHHRLTVTNYVHDNLETLPKIAIRETLVKLDTGKKTNRARAK
jgi:3-methyladenine DNA glycosylase AlkD